MSERFRAILIDKSDKTEKGQAFRFAEMTESELMAGDVTIAVEHSSVNYKDGLAITAKAPIVRRFPLIPGIDFAGVVISSTHDAFTPGDQVILNGWGVGETIMAALPSAPVSRATGWSPCRRHDDSPRHGNRHRRLYRHALRHGARAPRREFRPPAISWSPAQPAASARSPSSCSPGSAIASWPRPAGSPRSTFCSSLGAAAVIDRSEFAGPVKPLAKSRFAGAVDSVGSTTLANVLSQIDYGGTVAACGLAQGMDLPASVAPFILRGVKLIGINSVMCPTARRRRAWSRLARDLDLKKLGVITSHVPLDDVPLIAEEIVAGKVRGRVVVDL